MKTIVGIFAHPDDEAFFTGGTIATLSKDYDIYTICVTNGEAGLNSSSKKGDMATIRREELLDAGQILGVHETFFLGYKDGALSNNFYHEIADKIKKILEKLKPEILITFEMRGVSGHLDHIATSLISSYVFIKTPFVKEIWYVCSTEQMRESIKGYYIYWPPGYKKSEITKVVDIEPVWETKVAAMHKHASQMHDVETILKRFETLPKNEHFIIRNRKNI